jgi:hypothetical protein
MTKEQLTIYYNQYTDPNNENYSNHMWFNAMIYIYLLELA